MAWENFKWVWNVVGVSGSEYLILVYLADEANSKGVTPNITVEKIMRRCNLSRAAVYRFLAALEKKGLLRRKRHFANDGDFAANTYALDLRRYFPDGEYASATQMWKQIIGFLEDHPARVTPNDLRVLNYVRECFFQQNAKVLCMVTETDYYEEVLIKNLAHVKSASISLKLPVRRFETFNKPR